MVAAWAEARSLRGSKPGLAAIAVAYERVLVLDPQHRSATEALGMLLSEWKQGISSALMNDNVELAATRLERRLLCLAIRSQFTVVATAKPLSSGTSLKSTDALLASNGLSDCLVPRLLFSPIKRFWLAQDTQMH